jgi:bacterioferritin-associated ferredoxin
MFGTLNINRYSVGRTPSEDVTAKGASMIVCHCNAVNDRAIEAVIEEGAGDVESVKRACGAGSDCGGCLPHLHRLLAETAPPLRQAS